MGGLPQRDVSATRVGAKPDGSWNQGQSDAAYTTAMNLTILQLARHAADLPTMTVHIMPRPAVAENERDHRSRLY